MLEPQPPPPDEDLPRRFGDYLLLSRLGVGGMGEVYLAKHAGLAGVERPCVVKTLREHLAEDQEYVNRFIDEARVTVQLSHKNVCSVFDVGRIGRRYYLAMDLVVGRTLKDLWERSATSGRRLERGLALYILGEVLEALDYAHRRVDPMTGAPLGIVHRDVSPQNVMVSVEGEVKLIDFGLAASAHKTERTEPNVVLGKMAYMAPEHARGERVDATADQFAAVVCGYELVTGARFYEGKNAQQLWHTVGLGGFLPARFAELDEGLAAILARGLGPTPAERFATCGELREALASHAFSQGLRAGARELRQVLAELFPGELDEVTTLLRRYAEIKPPTQAAEMPGFEVHHIASTLPGTGVANAGVEPPALVPSPPLIQDAKEASAIDPAPPAPSTRGLRLALAAAGVALVLLAVVLVAREPPQPISPATTRLDPAPQLAAAAPPAAPSPPSSARLPSTAPASEATRPPPVVEALASEPAPPRPQPKAARRAQRGKREPTGKRPSPAPPTTFSEKLALLGRCSEPCAAPTLQDARRLLELSPEETLRTKRRVDACALQCAR